MNAEQREIFRDAILRALKAAGATGLTLVSIDTFLRSAGFRKHTNDDVENDLQYFVDKGFVALVKKSHSVANRQWRITAEGIDDLEARGM